MAKTQEPKRLLFLFIGENFMETRLEIFRNEEFGEVRTILVNGTPYFCLIDICKILELEQPSRVKDRLNPKGVTLSKVLTAG
jgi:prophage antirepressor-like protein